MFDLTKQSILTCASNRLAMLAFAAVTSAGVGACFNGTAAEASRDNDAQCGPGWLHRRLLLGRVPVCRRSVYPTRAGCGSEIDCEDGSDGAPIGAGANVSQAGATATSRCSSAQVRSRT
jgi:hypothetical protein